MPISLFSNNKQSSVANTEMPEKVLEQAHARAEKIIERALKKSEEIISEVENLRNEIRKELKTIFKQTSDSYVQTVTMQTEQFSEACMALVPELKSKYMTGVEKVLSDLQTSINQDFAPLHATVESKVKECTDELKKHIDEEWQNARLEIENYKKAKQSQLDEVLAEQVKTLALTAFGKALSVSQQQQLVQDALKQAKEDGVFNI